MKPCESRGRGQQPEKIRGDPCHLELLKVYHLHVGTYKLRRGSGGAVLICSPTSYSKLGYLGGGFLPYVFVQAACGRAWGSMNGCTGISTAAAAAYLGMGRAVSVTPL